MRDGTNRWVGVLGGSAVVAMGWAAAPARAASGAADTAGNYPVYSQFNGVNLGTGFQPWAVTSTVASSGGSYVNASSYDATGLPGQVFDVYDNGAGTLGSGVTTAVRPFATALTAGQTFSFKDVLHYANGPDASGAPTSSLGFSLLGASGSTLFTFAVGGGAAGYSLTDQTNAGTVEASVPYNYQSTYQFAFTPVDASGDYSFTVTGGGLSPAGVTFVGQTLGNLLPTAVAVFNNDGGYSSDVQFDDLSITAAAPEPGSLTLAGLAAVGLLGRRRNRGR